MRPHVPKVEGENVLTRVGTRKKRGPVCVPADKAKIPLWMLLVPIEVIPEQKLAMNNEN